MEYPVRGSTIERCLGKKGRFSLKKEARVGAPKGAVSYSSLLRLLAFLWILKPEGQVEGCSETSEFITTRCVITQRSVRLNYFAAEGCTNCSKVARGCKHGSKLYAWLFLSLVRNILATRKSVLATPHRSPFRSTEFHNLFDHRTSGVKSKKVSMNTVMLSKLRYLPFYQ